MSIIISGNGNVVNTGNSNSIVTIVNQNISNNGVSSDYFRKLVGNNKTKQALDELSSYLKLTNQDDFTILLSGRWSRIQRESNLGLVSFSEASVTTNQINHALLSYLDDVKFNNNSYSPVQTQEEMKFDITNLRRFLMECDSQNGQAPVRLKSQETFNLIVDWFKLVIIELNKTFPKDTDFNNYKEFVRPFEDALGEVNQTKNYWGLLDYLHDFAEEVSDSVEEAAVMSPLEVILHNIKHSDVSNIITNVQKLIDYKLQYKLVGNSSESYVKGWNEDKVNFERVKTPMNKARSCNALKAKYSM